MPVPCKASLLAANAAGLRLQEAEINMARFLHRMYTSHYCNPAPYILAFFWFCGILFGIRFSYTSAGLLASLMRSFLYDSVSIVGLVFLTFFPFLLSAFAVSISGRMLVYPIAFCKGCVFAFVSMGIFLCYGCAGWLIRLFLCFSDLLSLPLLYWFWLRLLGGDNSSAIRDGFAFLIPVFCIGSIDMCLVAPFFADLINL